MEIIQRDGKYFVKLLDGEIELNKEQLMERANNAKHTTDFLEDAKAIYTGVSVSEYSNRHEQFIQANLFFKNLKERFDLEFQSAKKSKAVIDRFNIVCRMGISQYKIEAGNPLDKNRDIKNYFVLQFEGVIEYIALAQEMKQPSEILTFESYLSDIDLLPHLKKIYANATSKKIVYMLIALDHAKLTTPGLSNISQVKLWEILKKAFGEIGTRQALNTNQTKMKDNPNEAKIVKEHKEKICSFYSANNAN